MPRRTKPLICSKTDIIELRALAADSSTPRVAKRAQMVLQCAEGHLIKDVAAMFSERPNTVIKWKERYQDLGINGLQNAPRGSTKDIYGEPFAKRLCKLLEGAPPNGEEYWTGPLLAEALGTPNDTVRRYLRRENIQLLEYRRRVKNNTPPDNQGAPHGEHRGSSPGKDEIDKDTDTRSNEEPFPTHIGDDALRDMDVNSLNEANSITCEKQISISITGQKCGCSEGDHPLDIYIHIKLMDGNTCIKESFFKLPGALPNLGQFDVDIDDSS